MKNDYEVSDALEVGRAQNVILGMKAQAPVADSVMGFGWRNLQSDLDESDE